ncbi:MAG: glycosyltransferase [Bacteroidota bacterium]|nr:glycosyltransferase [Bacteroidota bacterium]
MLFIELIVLVILFLYVLLISKYAAGWTKIKTVSKDAFLPKVSILIVMRNEESNLVRLYKSLQSQVYPGNKLEFILVNDHSTDNTWSFLEKWDLNNLHLLNMPKGKFGKKNAISMAVAIASGDIILASDADCSFSANWTRKMIGYFANNDVKLVSGPVLFNKKTGFFQNFQALEFTSLIASGAGAIGIQNPIFCNGANMAYRKEVFLEVNAFNKNNIASGDDVFLLHSIKEKYHNSIVFARNEDAIVTTESAQSFYDFINQRKRWVAKSSSYKDIASMYTSYVVLFTNATFVFLFSILFIDISWVLFFLGFYVIKFIVDLSLLYPVLQFLNRKDLIKWVLPFEFFYSFYIILIVILSFTTDFEWKGRVHNK